MLSMKCFFFNLFKFKMLWGERIYPNKCDTATEIQLQAPSVRRHIWSLFIFIKCKTALLHIKIDVSFPCFLHYSSDWEIGL